MLILTKYSFKEILMTIKMYHVLNNSLQVVVCVILGKRKTMSKGYACLNIRKVIDFMP